MPTKQQYRWRPAPWRVGQSSGKAAPAAEVKYPEEGGQKKNTGTVVLVLLGAGAVAFGVMELLGITKVFTPVATVPAALPAVPPAAAPAPAPAGK